MKKITILGSTGSIGTQALQVIEDNPEKFDVVALSCGSNIQKLSGQIRQFEPDCVCVASEEDAIKIRKEFPEIQVFSGEEGLVKIATLPADLVLNSLMGMRGLAPTYYAIEAGRDIALANKETLVAGGEIIMAKVAEKGVRLLPVDSEHCAIFQCLEGNKNRKIKKILLTASGGPFRGYNLNQLNDVTLEQALKHPKWTMGKKITIDSATLMNKGLEVIEAKWLFDVDLSQIQVLVHPQSIMHSAVEFEDTSVIAQLGVPDMKIPISFAFGYPDRVPSNDKSLDFFEEGSNLSFEAPDMKTFTCLRLAFEASEKGGSFPVALNAANEVLVDLFLNNKIKFIDIQNTLEKVLNEHEPVYNLGLEDILRIDKEVREYTHNLFE